MYCLGVARGRRRWLCPEAAYETVCERLNGIIAEVEDGFTTSDDAWAEAAAIVAEYTDGCGDLRRDFPEHYWDLRRACEEADEREEQENGRWEREETESIPAA